MNFDEVDDDLYTIPEDDHLKKKNFDNINRNLDQNVFTGSLKGKDKIEDNKKLSPLKKEDTSSKSKDKFKPTFGTANNDDKKHSIDKDYKQKAITNNLATNDNRKPTFNKQQGMANGIKEKDDTLNLSAIIDETENLKGNGYVAKNGSSFQTKDKTTPKNVLPSKDYKKPDAFHKPKEESLDLSAILEQPIESKARNDDKVVKEDLKTKKKSDENFQQNQTITYPATEKIYKEPVIEKDISHISAKNVTSISQNKLNNKVNNGGGVNGYIQTKLIQVESEFYQLKHKLDKMLLNDENKLIKYESTLDYGQAYDLLRKQHLELMKNQEKMNSFLNTIEEGTKSLNVNKNSNQAKPKKNITVSEVDAKIIAVYKKEYDTVSARLAHISEPAYQSRLEKIVSEMNRQIAELEIDNKRVRVEQKQSESKLGKSKYITETDQNSEIKKVNYEYESYQKQFNLVNTKINKNKDEIEMFEHRLTESNEYFLKLIEIANFYGITDEDINRIESSIKPENLGKIENDLDERKNVLLKKLEVIKKVKDQQKNKYEAQIKSNVSGIFKSETTKRELMKDLAEKSKLARGNTEKVKDFYDRHRNQNMSAIMEDFKKLNETMEKSKQNSTNYSTGHLGKRQILSSITEDINNEINSPKDHRAKSELIPIEEKDMEETIGKGKLDDLGLNKSKSNKEEMTMIRGKDAEDKAKTEDKTQKESKEVIKEEVKPKVEDNKYGIKEKPKFKLGKTETKAEDISKPTDLKKDEEIKKEKNEKTEIKVKTELLSNENKGKDNDQSPQKESKKELLISNDKENLNKKEQNTKQEEIVIEDINSRRKKPQNQNNTAFLPIIENKEEKEREEREKIRGRREIKTKDEEKPINRTSENQEQKRKVEFQEKKPENEKKPNLEKKELKKEENKKVDDNKSNDSIPLFLQNSNNKQLVESKVENKQIDVKPKEDSSKKTVKNNEFFEDKDKKNFKEDNSKNSEGSSKDLKEKKVKPNNEKEKEVKDQQLKPKEEKKSELKPIKNITGANLFADIFSDNEDDVKPKQTENRNETKQPEKVVPTKKKEDFDKLFSKETVANSNLQSNKIEINTEKKKLPEKLDAGKEIGKLETKPKEAEKPKKKVQNHDLDDLVI